MKLNKNAKVFYKDNDEKYLAKTTDLCFSAHQDDIEIMAYGPISKCYRDKDNWFTGVVITDGAGSPRSGIYADYSNDSENNYVYNLMQAHSVDTSNDRSTTAAPFYFVRAGYADSSFSSPGYNGYYWTNHSSSSSSAYYYYHSSSSFYAQGSTLSKYYRASVRCVAR